MFTVLIVTVLAAAPPLPDILPDCLPDIVVISQEPLVDAVRVDEAPPPIPVDKPKRVLVVKPPASNCPGGNCQKPMPTYQPRGLLRRWR